MKILTVLFCGFLVAGSIPSAHAQFSTSTGMFQLGLNSFDNSGDGSGTLNSGAWLGFNEGRHSGDPVVEGKSGLMMGFEDNYFDFLGDQQFAKEWYVEGWSPDGTTVQMSRPFYARGSQQNDGTDWWVITHNIGVTGENRQFTVRAGSANLFSILPSGITMNLPTTVLGYFATAGLGAGIDIKTCLTDSPLRRNWGFRTEVSQVGDFAIQCSAANGWSVPSVTMLELTRDGKMGVGGVSFPQATLHVAGNVATAINAGGSVLLGETDSTYLVNFDGGSIVLPTAVNKRGRSYTIKAISPAESAVVAASGTEVIDGTSSYSLIRSNQFVTVQSDGTNWWVIGGN